MKRPTAADVMARTEITLSPEDPIRDATARLLKHKLVGAPVIDLQRRLVGILTDLECFSALADEALNGLPAGSVRDYMRREVDTLDQTASLYELVVRFRRSMHRKFPVVDPDGRVVGQVSRRDVLRAIEAMRDDSYLYGVRDEQPSDVTGVDSAMRMARRQP